MESLSFPLMDTMKGLLVLVQKSARVDVEESVDVKHVALVFMML
jgi:hypothetical protein